MDTLEFLVYAILFAASFAVGFAHGVRSDMPERRESEAREMRRAA